MSPCEFAGRHSPPPAHDGHADYNCGVCGAKVRPAIRTGVPRQEEAPPPGFAQAIRFVVDNPNGLPLPPGDYVARMGEPHRVTGIIPLTIIRNVTDDGK